MSLLGKLKSANATIAAEQYADPWLAPLQRVRGKVELDGLERVSSQTSWTCLRCLNAAAQRAPIDASRS
jgi:hypothetical protein